MKPKYSILRSQIEKILWITFFYFLISIFLFFTGYAAMLRLDLNTENQNFTTHFIGSIVSGISGGLIGGTFLVFFWSTWLRTLSYRRSLLNIFLTYTMIYGIVAVITSLFYRSSEFNIFSFERELWLGVWSDITSILQVQSYFLWLFIVLITIVALLVNDKYGPGIFASFLLGKYFHPKREERVFMFLDLRGSTTMAEQLGEERYFNFLKEVYRDSTPAILRTNGEIYQYVGDEIVISWKKKIGIENANAIYCFFEIQQCFLNLATYYKDRYDGIVPEFKAGLHCGSVMAGEIGILKRDIVYSGDVLNTTARIQAKCNELKVNILLSEYLINTLARKLDHFQPSEVGRIALRGKKEPLLLYTL